MSPLIIGIAGPSGSGKTTLASALTEALGDRALLIHHDRYYRDVEHPPSFNYDVPEAYETDLLLRHMDHLRQGQDVALPVYHFATHRRQPEPERVSARPFVFVEGILVLSDPRLRDRMHLRVFVDTAADLCLARRVERDVVSRGRDAREVIGRYLRDVRPAMLQHIVPSRDHAHLVVDGATPLEQLVQRVSERLAAL